MRSLSTSLGLALVALVVTLGMVGCGGPKEFSEDDFKKVEKGAAESKVSDTLGKPKETIDLGSNKALFYESKGKFYYVALKDGKVDDTKACKDKTEYDLTLGLAKAAKELKDKMPK